MVYGAQGGFSAPLLTHGWGQSATPHGGLHQKLSARLLFRFDLQSPPADDLPDLVFFFVQTCNPPLLAGGGLLFSVAGKEGSFIE